MRFQVAPDHSASFPGTRTDIRAISIKGSLMRCYHSLSRSLMRGFPLPFQGQQIEICLLCIYRPECIRSDISQILCIHITSKKNYVMLRCHFSLIWRYISRQKVLCEYIFLLVFFCY